MIFTGRQAVLCSTYQSRSWNRLYPGCDGSVVMFAYLFPDSGFVKKNADLTVCCSLFLSDFAAEPNQTVMDKQRTDWITV